MKNFFFVFFAIHAVDSLTCFEPPTFTLKSVSVELLKKGLTLFDDNEQISRIIKRYSCLNSH